MNFDGFYGNERAKAYLDSAFARNALPHALLISGERGIGKKTLANILARAIVCAGESAPCGKCDACYKSEKGFHPDIISIDAEKLKSDAAKYGIIPKKDGLIHVIRELKLNALLRPNDGERKVYIIDNAGTLSHDCQDALLKILEEPPLFTFFIILCYNLSDLLPTIVSRAAHIALSPLSDSDMLSVINKNMPGISGAERDELIKTSGGICSFLVYEKDNDCTEAAVNIARALISADELEIFRAISVLDKRDRDGASEVFDELCILFRDACVISSGARSTLISHDKSGISEKLAAIFPPKASCSIIDLLTNAKVSCMRNVGLPHITGNLICKLADTAAKAALKG
ncbi:MAG: hypothetical protein IJN09_07090 [Oscillospiraceae bacterium]|nr:hypothetical protein [Oscillospiraceae bacterium]